VFEIGHNFANVDITKEPIPVVPTIHYQMGGIPTNINGQVVVPKNGDPNAVVNGLYAVGECSCVSVHGANRLGTNSLLDLVVFGRAAGNHIVDSKLKGQAHKALPADAADRSLARLARLDGNTSGEYAQAVANDIRTSMQKHAGVFRTQAMLDEGVRQIAALRERVGQIALKDKSKVFNTARIEALEVDNLIEAAQATIVSAARARVLPPWSTMPTSSPSAATTPVAEALRRRPVIQAGEAAAADGGQRAAEGADLLIARFKPSPTT
jgi:succinate dehydrogenase / fumarate reductase flavoprotein subunit